mgnify:CR=1 FL=1
MIAPISRCNRRLLCQIATPQAISVAVLLFEKYIERKERMETRRPKNELCDNYSSSRTLQHAPAMQKLYTHIYNFFNFIVKTYLLLLLLFPSSGYLAAASLDTTIRRCLEIRFCRLLNVRFNTSANYPKGISVEFTRQPRGIQFLEPSLYIMINIMLISGTFKRVIEYAFVVICLVLVPFVPRKRIVVDGDRHRNLLLTFLICWYLLVLGR